MPSSLFIGGARQSVKFLRFPGGETHVQCDFRPGFVEVYANLKIRILAHLHSAQDVMELLMLTDAVRQWNPDAKIDLCMPYVPYARQDRVSNAGESLSIKVFASLINQRGYSEVEVWDPHSDVTTVLLDRVKVIPQDKFLFNLFGQVSDDNTVLVSPDAGANKKVLKAAQSLRLSNVVRADKVRDTKTGAITGTVVYSEHVGDKNFFIVDDICDGGRTFIELAKVLRPLTTGKIELYVTHGIFSAGFAGLKEHIDNIYTANPFPEILPDFVTVLKI